MNIPCNGNTPVPFIILSVSNNPWYNYIKIHAIFDTIYIFKCIWLLNIITSFE